MLESDRMEWDGTGWTETGQKGMGWYFISRVPPISGKHFTIRHLKSTDGELTRISLILKRQVKSRQPRRNEKCQNWTRKGSTKRNRKKGTKQNILGLEETGNDKTEGKMKLKTIN